jgi:hypothetical protein
MPKKSSSLSNAERQRRWRERRKSLFKALTGGSSATAAAAIIAELGVDKARKVAKALEQKATKHDREL